MLSFDEAMIGRVLCLHISLSIHSSVYTIYLPVYIFIRIQLPPLYLCISSRFIYRSVIQYKYLYHIHGSSFALRTA